MSNPNLYHHTTKDIISPHLNATKAAIKPDEIDEHKEFNPNQATKSTIGNIHDSHQHPVTEQIKEHAKIHPHHNIQINNFGKDEITAPLEPHQGPTEAEIKNQYLASKASSKENNTLGQFEIVPKGGSSENMTAPGFHGTVPCPQNQQQQQIKKHKEDAAKARTASVFREAEPFINPANPTLDLTEAEKPHATHVSNHQSTLGETLTGIAHSAGKSMGILDEDYCDTHRCCHPLGEDSSDDDKAADIVPDQIQHKDEKLVPLQEHTEDYHAPTRPQQYPYE